MKRCFSAVLLMTTVVSAQTFPPDNCRLLTPATQVVLRWPAVAHPVTLQVTASGRPVFQGLVSASEYALAVRPGVPYRWSLDGGSEHSFQVQSELRFDFRGRPGDPGRPLPTGILMDKPKPDMQHGKAGGDGRTIRVVLLRGTDGVQVEIENQKYLLDSKCPPLEILAQGGDGGPGAPGQDGTGGSSVDGYNPNGQFGYPGGKGGDGGKGGTIEVLCNGLNAQDYLHCLVDGGKGGKGGRGGKGGVAGTSHSAPGSPGYVTGMDGRDGAAGPDGQTGAAGRLLIH